MESNDKQQNGPEEQPMEPAEERPAAEQPTAEQGGPQAPAGEAPTAPPRRRLSRSRDDRVVAGVCGGIARYFNIDPVFVRIGAVALAFVGGAGLLLYLAALLLMPSDEGGAVVEASGIDIDGGMGEREYRPGSTVDLRDRYELGIGDLEIDLRQTDLPGGDVPLEVDLGIGEARVLVPDDVCVATTADIGAGNVETFGRDTGGVDVDFEDIPDASPATTRLLVDADIGLGALRVMESDGLHPGDNSACDPTGERASG